MNYSKTINLPQTSFSMKANLSQSENNWIEFWEKQKIYEVLKKQSEGSKKFILHDGPPYANGDLHLGHALNKILKDIICRHKFFKKFDVDFIPGWDCHGLPIEWKIEEKLKKKGKNKNDVDLQTFRQECREFAEYWVDKQMLQFKRFGIQTDWQKIYLTMTKDIEVSIVEELMKFFEAGNLYLGFKPVMWSVVEQTALAEAEIDYHEKISKSIYVKFPVMESSENLSVVIWTTTPWTIPCNRAIAFSENLDYKVLKFSKNFPENNFKKNEKILISESLIKNFVKLNNINDFKVLRSLNKSDLRKIRCSHPLKKLGYNFEVKLYPSEHVTDDTGTGLVHIAPNHGLEDFELGQKFDLGNEPTVNPNGIYSDKVPFFSGLHVFKADNEVISELKKSGNLIVSSDYNHSYPHSWRSKAPLIFRATSQWFVSMKKNNLRKKILNEIDKVKWIPEISENRIFSMISERPDWCISRQRNWGVPITIFLEKKSQKPLLDPEVNNKILSVLKDKGVDSWFNLPNKDFLTKKYNPDNFIKVKSILDVWFDSGSSHVYVLKNRGIKKADLYIEGSDQHRGWFQSSLIESCAIYGQSPYKSVLTHGFVIDEKGKKMSKSLGNVISPQEVIKKYGSDILRIWVASSNYNEDVRISFENLDRHSESYRKIRNSMRFILGNLNGWDLKNRVDYNDLPDLEKFILNKLYQINSQVLDNYESFNFNKAFQLVLNFCNFELSSFFFDIRKDTLYCEDQKSLLVNSTKTVMSHVFEVLISWLTPIIPFTTEEAWQCWRSEIDAKAKLSCHLLKQSDLKAIWKNDKIRNEWIKIFQIRDAFLFLAEKKRNNKEIKSVMEANVEFYFKNNNYNDIFRIHNLNEILMSAEVGVSEKIDDEFEQYPEVKEIYVKIKKSNGEKCPRCWRFFHRAKVDQILCGRCNVVTNNTQ